LDRALAALTARQHGVASRTQLTELGFSRDGIATRVAAHRLHRLHRGVYTVAPSLLSPKGRWLAAVIAIGPGAALSHRPAAALWELLPAGAGPPEVLVARNARKRSGVTVRCAHSLPADHVASRHGIACTTVARTLADLAPLVSPRVLERVLGQAEVLRLYDRTAIEAILDAHPRRAGSRTLRSLIASPNLATGLSRSPLEERFLLFCDSASLPRPELNAPFTLPDGTEIVIDALWRTAQLAVELDGRPFHMTHRAMVRDRRRDAQLTLAGYRPIRLMDADLSRESERTAELLCRLLAVG
jgi:hypothetical protein